jgi:hypothetical protein
MALRTCGAVIIDRLMQEVVESQLTLDDHEDESADDQTREAGRGAVAKA